MDIATANFDRLGNWAAVLQIIGPKVAEVSNIAPAQVCAFRHTVTARKFQNSKKLAFLIVFRSEKVVQHFLIRRALNFGRKCPVKPEFVKFCVAHFEFRNTRGALVGQRGPNCPK